MKKNKTIKNLSKWCLPMVLFVFMHSNIIAQTASGTAGTNNCLNGGTVTANSTGLGVTPQYQLLKSGVVVAPVSGNAAQFTNTNLFSGLEDGSYTVKARASSAGTVYTSGNITVDDGYVAMAITTPTKLVSCPTAMVPLTTTINAIGGKAPFTYKIALQSSPSTIIQNSGAITPRNFTFSPLAVENYIVSVTDACGNTITGATAISSGGATLNQIFPQTFNFGRIGVAGDCTSKIMMRAKDNFAYVGSQNAIVSAADKANFSWRLEFNGLSYGKDIDADGNPDLAGPNFDLNTIQTTLPLGITQLAAAVAGNPKMVIYDQCNNSKTFIPSQAKIYTSSVVCGGNGIVQLYDANGVSTLSMACYPVDWTFTSSGNPTITYSQTSVKEIIPQNFVPGATYTITAIDAAGNINGSITQSATVTIPPVTSTPYYISQITRSGLYYNMGGFLVFSNYSLSGDIINVQITASDVPSMVGYNYNYTVPSNTNGSLYFSLPNPPTSNAMPAGSYTLKVTGPCGTMNQTINVSGYKGILSSLTTSPVCGGFNVVANTTLIESATLYEIVIVSGPSNAGTVRELSNLTTSLPFNGLAYGTYVFGIRVKGNGVVFNTQTVTYGAANAITVDNSQTGGFVCSAGASDGTLTIVATTNSPAPGNTLEYTLSLDGGATYGAYQSSNTFSGLTNGTYYFKVKDGCGNIVTQSAQVGVAAAPTATANGVSSPATFCKLNTGTIQMDVDITGASSYLWTGPGITAANQSLKNPQVNYSAVAVGTNNYTCTVTLGAPCNSSSVSNLSVKINTLPTVVINNPATVCAQNTINLTAPAVTAGSDAGLTYTYFKDASATITLSNPNAVTTSGTYYIKGSNANCSDVKPVVVTINNCPATITDTSCSNNGTFDVTTDDFMIFKVAPGNTSNYSVTATFAGNPVSVLLMNNNPATNVTGEASTYFKVANGGLSTGNFSITLTPTIGSSETLLVANTGTCSTACTTSSTGNKVTYYYSSPYQNTDLTNATSIIPKFNPGTNRVLTNVKVDYGITFLAKTTVDNSSATAKNVRFKQDAEVTYVINGNSYSNTVIASKNPSYPASNSYPPGNTTVTNNFAPVPNTINYSSPSDIANFVGSGNVTTNVSTLSSFAGTAATGVGFSTATQVSYFYKVEYTYDCVSSECTKPAATGTPDGYTKVGITVQKKQNEWPENIPNGFITLESREKGFVITRVSTAGDDSGAPLASDPITDPKEGMIIYDIADKCVKLFNGKIWNCIKKSCNDTN